MAVLTLADGRTILLDSVNNGLLAHEGNTRIIKLDNGQIAYDTKDGSKITVVMNTMATLKEVNISYYYLMDRRFGLTQPVLLNIQHISAVANVKYLYPVKFILMQQRINQNHLL